MRYFEINLINYGITVELVSGKRKHPDVNPKWRRFEIFISILGFFLLWYFNFFPVEFSPYLLSPHNVRIDEAM